MSDNLLDLAVGLEVGKRFPCDRAVDLQAIDEGGNGDEAVGLDILLELVVDLLVENDGVLGLVLDYRNVSRASSLRSLAVARALYGMVDALGEYFERVGMDALCSGVDGVRCDITYPCP